MIKSKHIFCDWITVSQRHEVPHEPFTSGSKTINLLGEQPRTTAIAKSVPGKHGSNVQISSDGLTVRYSGNPSREDRSENLHGLDIDQAKQNINHKLRSMNLPPFTGGPTIQISSRRRKSDKESELVYTGARISRLDATANLATGSPENRRAYLQHLQTQEFPNLEKYLTGLNLYYGKMSESRTILIYDKAKQLRDELLKKTDEPEYITRLIDWIENRGIIRFEISMRDYLRGQNLSKWDNITHSKISKLTTKDINSMTKEIKAPDFGDMPLEAIKILGMYMMGLPLKKLLHRNTFGKYKKILKGYGYDISNQNIHILEPKVRIITLEPAGVPDFYKHAKVK